MLVVQPTVALLAVRLTATLLTSSEDVFATTTPTALDTTLLPAASYAFAVNA